MSFNYEPNPSAISNSFRYNFYKINIKYTQHKYVSKFYFKSLRINIEKIKYM